MKKGIIPKLSMGVALMGAIALTSATRASADLGSTVTFTEPAETLVMPFDSTTGKVSFQIVSRIGGAETIIATHWSYWSKDCNHLADVFICLTQRDTVVVDPTKLQGELQGNNVNTKLGPVIDLSGNKGLVTVTSFEASEDSLSRRECVVADTSAVLPDQIVGAWTIANTSSNAAFANDAIGLSTSIGLPAASTFLTDVPFYIPTFNPSSLQDSEVIFLSLELSDFSGNGDFESFEIGPISHLGSPKVCCDAAYIDNLEVRTSLPDICFDCVGFAPISDNVAEEGEISLIPPTISATTSGLLELTNCTALSSDPETSGLADLGDNDDQFIFAFHGQAVGPFGAVVKGKYTGGLETNG
jgi:hypothetical protein